MAQILVIEDETAIADTLIYALTTEGHQVEHHTLASTGLLALKEKEFDLLVLDVGLPDGNGFDLCRQIRGFSELPVIFLTARAGEIDRVVGLEIGADDYVTKPFSPRELAARVRVILRRVGKGVSAPEAPTETNTSLFRLDARAATIHYDDQLLQLTRYEYLILKSMIEQPERVFSREQLIEKVWVSPGYSLDRTVDTHIKTIRAKLRAVLPNHDPIRTQRGLGYSLSVTR